MPSWNISPSFRLTTTAAPVASDEESSLQNAVQLTGPATEADEANKNLGTVRETLDQLRKWHSWEIRRQRSLRWYLASKVFPRRPPCPSRTKLKDLALFFFPHRATAVKVEICDFGEGRFERFITTIDEAKLRKSDISHYKST